MEDKLKSAVWDSILAVLEDKLQMGLLLQARAVSAVRVEGNELVLTCPTPETREFFSAHVNQQRLIILSRQVASFEKIRVE
jgi:hypothetical protein